MDMILDSMEYLEKSLPDIEGYFVVGYPRDVVQLQAFEEKVKPERSLESQPQTFKFRSDSFPRLV
jgi:hypothetical protein